MIIMYLVALGYSSAFVNIVVLFIKEVKVTSINITSTADISDDNDNDIDIKKAMYSIVLHFG